MTGKRMAKILKIGRVPLDGDFRVAFSVPGYSAGLRGISRRGVHMIEARVDRFHSLEPSDVAGEIRAIKKTGLPVIATIRSRKEGGAVSIPDAKRAALFQIISPLVDAIDVELGSGRILKKAVASARRNRNCVIISYHNFSRTPPKAALERIMRRAIAAGADVVKIAAMAKNQDDVARLFMFTQDNRRRNLITISMGPAGSVSRVVFFLAGSLLTYTSASPTDGQIPLERLVRNLKLLKTAG